MTISRRTFAKIISLSVGISLALFALCIKSANEAAAAKRAVGNSYMRAVEEISLNLESIKNNLEKGIYTNSISMLSALSEKLCTDAASAKNALSGLPLDELDLSETYRFLSQVGNYSKSLAHKCAGGSRLTDEENENIRKLYSYADKLSSSMWKIEEKIEHGEISFDDIENKAGQPVSVTDGFADFTSEDVSFPSLIYDGPFSDHLLDRTPVMLEGQDEISYDEAAKRAASLLGAGKTESAGEEGGRMPSYVFTDGERTVGITRSGGMFTYMLSHRETEGISLTSAQAVAKAKEFMSKLGIRGLTDTYFEVDGGVCVINLAAVQNGAVLYTDLIKVDVALDNGEILGFDMRGYLTNHRIRDLGTPKITAAGAEGLVSEKLAVTGTKLCVIPSDGGSEKLCYEVRCTGQDGENILVYLNAATGREEQILLLQIGRNGMLTV